MQIDVHTRVWGTFLPRYFHFTKIRKLNIIKRCEKYEFCRQKERMVMGNKELRLRMGDLIAAALVAALAVGIFFLCLPAPDHEAGQAQIYLGGELIHTLPLDEDQELTVTDAYANTITVRGGKVAITQSDCPGTDCVHSGWIGTTGRSIVCLPNALEIRVVARTGDVDFVVG